MSEQRHAIENGNYGIALLELIKTGLQKVKLYMGFPFPAM
jgi:hypothetical protein